MTCMFIGPEKFSLTHQFGSLYVSSHLDVCSFKTDALLPPPPPHPTPSNLPPLPSFVEFALYFALYSLWLLASSFFFFFFFFFLALWCHYDVNHKAVLYIADCSLCCIDFGENRTMWWCIFVCVWCVFLFFHSCLAWTSRYCCQQPVLIAWHGSSLLRVSALTQRH